MSQEEKWGYILRLSTDTWLKQVYELKKYYPGINRRWKRETIILLAKKAEEGDSFIGYGVIDKIEMPWELPPEEEAYCREQGWKSALSFKTLFKFERPYPIKKSILTDDPRKGRTLHGARLSEEQVDAILEAAEDYQG